jgi:glycosyltransferase involved in cell wall biosynthesis
VLLPVRDALPHLDRCIESLGRQTLTDFEVVAVDDGSIDGTGDVLDRWAKSDFRVRVLHRSASGLIEALNSGLEACRAPLVARMDADDVSHPRRLELQTGLLDARPDVGVVSCLVRHFPWRGVGEGFRIYQAWLDSLLTHDDMARERFVESPLAHPSVVVRRELLVEAGGYRDLGWPEDYDLWLRLFSSGMRFAKVDRPLYFWREHSGRLTRSHDRYSTDAFLRCKAHFLMLGPLAAEGPVVVWGAGQTGRRLSRHLMDEGAKIEAFVDIDPDKIGRTLRGRPIVAPNRLPYLLGPSTVVLAAVASRGARQLIRDRLEALDLTEAHDYWCVA